MNKSILAGVTRGKQRRAQRVCIYGVESVGKTTFAANAPQPIFLDVEGGTHHLDAARVEINSYADLKAAVTELSQGDHDFRTAVIDSADWTEKLLIEDLLAETKKKSIEDFGYGKGWVQVAERFARLLTACDRLIDGGINVFFIAHSQVKRVEPPDQMAAYDRYELKLSKQCSPLLKEWADELWFAQFKTKLVESESGRMKGKGGKERVIYTTHSAAYDAKTRSGLGEELALDWAHVSHLFEANPATAKKPAAKAEKHPGWTLEMKVNEAIGGALESEQMTAFMVAKGKLEQGQQWCEADEAFLTKIVEAPERFITAVQRYHEEKEAA
jgi:hypothetical protein